MLENKEWSMVWQQPLAQCDVYAACGPYGLCNNNNVQSCNCLSGFVPKDTREWESQQWSSGCVRKTPLQCSHARNQTTTDGFVELSGTSMPPQGVQYKGKVQCQEACLSNCSCTAYAYILTDTLQTCVMWFGKLVNLSDTSNGISLFLRLDASEVPASFNSKKRTTDLVDWGRSGCNYSGPCLALFLVLQALAILCNRIHPRNAYCIQLHRAAKNNEKTFQSG